MADNPAGQVAATALATCCDPAAIRQPPRWQPDSTPEATGSNHTGSPASTYASGLDSIHADGLASNLADNPVSPPKNTAGRLAAYAAKA